MSIIRGPRPKQDFSIVSNEVIEDESLTWEARGMLIFLLSKPDYWQVNVKNLINQTEHARKHLKRDGVLEVLRELVNVGYITRSQPRAEDGTLGGINYIVMDRKQAQPQPENPDAAPQPDLPFTAQPLAANPDLVITDKEQGLNKDQELKAKRVRKTKPKAERPETELPSWLPTGTWQDFLAMRRDIKKPLTSQAVTRMLNKLERMRAEGHNIEACLDQSIVNNWQDVFPVRGAELVPPGRQQEQQDSDDWRSWGAATANEKARHAGMQPYTPGAGVSFDIFKMQVWRKLQDHVTH